MVEIYGTLGPSCETTEVLTGMFREGMTGIRINLSHVMLADCRDKIEIVQRAAASCGVTPKILIDMQGPEIRIGKLERPVEMSAGDLISFGQKNIPVSRAVLSSLEFGDEVLLDDGKISVSVTSVNEECAEARVNRGGILNSRKSLAIVGKSIDMPPLTESDIQNIGIASECGITGVMQPFVRSSNDLEMLRSTLDESLGQDIKIYAKIENIAGFENLESFFPYADEIIIARGDLGNAMPLWELPKVQKEIANRCNENEMPFMVVTQMLSSMEHSEVPTRAEVSDIYNAVLDGASSVMVTGETAIGDHPVEVIKYLAKTVRSAEAL